MIAFPGAGRYPADLGDVDVVMKILALSPAVLTLFRNHAERQGEVPLNDTNRPVYEELAAAGLMMAGHRFTQGRNSFYTRTKEGFERKGEICASANESE